MSKFKLGDLVEILVGDYKGYQERIVGITSTNNNKLYSILNIVTTYSENDLKFIENDKFEHFYLNEDVKIVSGELENMTGIISGIKNIYLYKVKIKGLGEVIVHRERIERVDKKENSTDESADHQLHKDIINEIHETYLRKNADYGNSFGDQYSEYGLLSALIRLDDKMRRLKQLTKQKAQVKDESIEDTLLDLSNYCIMTVMELRKDNAIKSNSK